MDRSHSTGPGARPAPLLSVIIPVHDQPGLTAACLASLRRQAAPFAFEIVVVDNGSGPETAAWLEAEPDLVRIRLERNHGYPAGVNAGARAARGSLLLALNNDTLLPAGTLARLARAWQTQDRAGLVAPSSDRVKGPQAIRIERIQGDPERVEAAGRLVEANFAGKVEDVPRVVGMAMLTTRELWERLGGLDERFGLGNFEDDDLCLRLRAQGRRILIARDTFIHHQSRATFDALGVDYKNLIRDNQELYLAKWAEHPVLAGELSLLCKDVNRALAACRIALTEGRRDWQVFAVLGEAFLTLGRPAEAVGALDQLLRLAPRHSVGALLRAAALAELDRERALREAVAGLLLDFYMDDRSAAGALSLLAGKCLAWGRPEEAEDYYRTALMLEPDFGEACCGLASCALERGDKPSARARLEQAGSEPTALAMLGAMAWEEGRLEAARDLFLEALGLDPGHAPSLSGLAGLEAQGVALPAAPTARPARREEALLARER